MEAVDQFLKEEGPDAITCLPATLIPDLNRAPSIAAHKKELVRGERAKYHLAVLAQRRHIEATNRVDRAYREGFGRRVASIHPRIARALAMEYGPSWFRDRKLLYRVLKENPCLAVNCQPPKTRVLVNGLRKEKTAKQFGDPARIPGKPNGSDAGHAASGDPPRPQRVKESEEREPKSSGHETTGVASERLEVPWMVPVLKAMGV